MSGSREDSRRIAVAHDLATDDAREAGTGRTRALRSLDMLAGRGCRPEAAAANLAAETAQAAEPALDILEAVHIV